MLETIEKPKKNKSKGKIKVAWTKGHAKEEDIQNGKNTWDERKTNEYADGYADDGREAHQDIKIHEERATQREIVTRLIQTMQAKIWTERTERIKEEEIKKAIEEDELNQLQQIEQEWEQNFRQHGLVQANSVEVDPVPTRTTSWREIKIRAPNYHWGVETEATEEIKLGPDIFAEN